MKPYHRKISLVTGLIATLWFTAPVAQAHSPRPRELIVSIQTLRVETQTLVVVSAKAKSPREFVWYKSTRFIENNHFVDTAALKEGMQVTVYYHSPFFGKPWITKVVWQSPNSATPPGNVQ